MIASVNQRERPPSEGVPAAASGRRILMVEDEQILAADITQLLRPLGYDVVAAAPTGADAIDLAEEVHPDLLLVDIGLPGPIDGIDAVTRIREQSDVPVIYLTAFSDESTLRRAGATHPVGTIIKPYERNHLLETITASVPPAPAPGDSPPPQAPEPAVPPERSATPPPAETSPEGVNWRHITTLRRERDEIDLYRDERLGVQLQVVNRTAGFRRGHARYYFFIDGVRRIFRREGRMLRALQRNPVPASLDRLIASCQRFVHSFSLL